MASRLFKSRPAKPELSTSLRLRHRRSLASLRLESEQRQPLFQRVEIFAVQKVRVDQAREVNLRVVSCER